MDLPRARKIVSALAEGIDPLTGEVLPDDHICNQGEIVRAFYAMLKATEEDAPKYRNAGKPWTENSDQELKALFEQGESISALSRHFQRTKNAIDARLEKLGLKNNA